MQIIATNLTSHGVSISSSNFSITKYELNTNTVYIQKILNNQDSQIITQTNTIIKPQPPDQVSVSA
jgi:hypothetical protein